MSEPKPSKTEKSELKEKIRRKDRKEYELLKIGELEGHSVYYKIFVAPLSKEQEKPLKLIIDYLIPLINSNDEGELDEAFEILTDKLSISYDELEYNYINDFFSCCKYMCYKALSFQHGINQKRHFNIALSFQAANEIDEYLASNERDYTMEDFFTFLSGRYYGKGVIPKCNFFFNYLSLSQSGDLEDVISCYYQEFAEKALHSRYSFLWSTFGNNGTFSNINNVSNFNFDEVKSFFIYYITLLFSSKQLCINELSNTAHIILTDNSISEKDKQIITSNNYEIPVYCGAGYDYVGLCPNCNKFFEKVRKDQVYCTNRCMQTDLQRKRRALQK